VNPAVKILLVDDNDDAVESLREWLMLEGHVVETAACGDAALERARCFHPDVMVCDIGLPGMDGYQVARAIRADPMLRSIRLVALSGYALSEDVMRAKAAGFDDHLAKPPSLDGLEQALMRSP